MFDFKMDTDTWMLLVFVILTLVFVLLEFFFIWRQKSAKFLIGFFLGFIAIQSVWLLIYLWMMGEYIKMAIPAVIILTGPTYWLYLVLAGRGNEVMTVRTTDQPMKSFRLACTWRKKKP